MRAKGLASIIKCRVSPVSVCWAVAALLLLSSCSRGQSWVVKDDGSPKQTKLFLPYIFYTEALGVAYGAGGGVSGLGQESAAIGAGVMRSTRGASGVYFVATNYRLGERVFTDARIASGWYKELRGYYSPEVEHVRNEAGFIEADGADDFVEIDINWVLPIGAGRDGGLHNYYLENGLLQRNALGGERWNPFKGGRTQLQIRPFLQHRSYDIEPEAMMFNSNGLRLGLSYDNRDFEINPSRGSYQEVAVKRDFGQFDSSDSWTTVELDYRKYLSVGLFSGSVKQDVLALQGWWIDTPTWQVSSLGQVQHRAPHFMGAALGGWNRLKGYASARFNSRSAAYYGAEYRITPHWNPLGDLPLPFGMQVDWWQFVVFGELGQVTSQWSMRELHKDMIFSGGGGARIYISNVLVRMDFAVSDEARHFWIMVGQTF